MRSDWVPLSASALVVGALALVCGTLLDPSSGGDTASDTLRMVQHDGNRWAAMAVLYFFGSVALTLGLPTILTLVERRGHRIGLVGLGLYAVGAIGTCGFAMLLVFFRALSQADAIRASRIDAVDADRMLNGFLYVWIGGFYGGVLLLAVALLMARTTPRWVPLLLLAFVVLMPVAHLLGRVGPAIQVIALTVAFTGIATAAVGGHERARVREGAF